jgi:hypothetical protein
MWGKGVYILPPFIEKTPGYSPGYQLGYYDQLGGYLIFFINKEPTRSHLVGRI